MGRCAAAVCRSQRPGGPRRPAGRGVPGHIISRQTLAAPRVRPSGRGMRRAHSHAGDVGASTAPGDHQNDYEGTLHNLLKGDVETLRQLPDDHMARTMDFLCWLANYELEVDDAAREEVNGLAGRLVAMREGLDPSSVDQHVPTDSALRSVALTTALPHGQARTSFAIEVQRAADMALTPEGNAVFDEKVSDLRDGMMAAKRESALQLMGRQQFPTLEQAKVAEQAAAASDASGRILSFLLELPSRRERQAILPDAFKPPQTCADEADEDEEQLFTSPFALLSAIDMELARFKREVSMLPSAGLLTGTATGAVDEPLLRELRDDVMDYIESSM